HLDVAPTTDYTYNIKTVVPGNISSYKSYVISDTLEKELEAKSATIKGAAADYFTVTVKDQVVTASVKDFAAAKAIAGQEVELVIVSQIREGVTRQNIPNTTKITFSHKPIVNGEEEPKGETPPKDTPPTPPVTVTPPTPNTPPLTKKVNGAERAELSSRQEVFTYTIDTTVPTGASAFEVSDTLESVLQFEGTVSATLDGKALTENQIVINDQTLTVMLTKDQVRSKAGKAVQVVFKASVKSGADLTPYIVEGVTSVPNTATYTINNNPSTKKQSNTVPVVPPTPEEPSIDKKINQTLEHLEIATNTSYMYNVTANLPIDIASYESFVVTDKLEDVLAINGQVVAYVDGSETDAVKVTVEGNLVTATVVDFTKLAGAKQIQLYIPAYIKANADLSSYLVEGVAKVPNTAQVAFRDSNGKDGHKPTKPVTVTPPTPVEPPKPEEPTPGEPVKTVSRVEGLEQAALLRLLDRTEAFRFDIKSVVPSDEAEDKRIQLTSFTLTDLLDPLFVVKHEGIAVKVTEVPAPTANFVDEDVEKSQVALEQAKAKLEELRASLDQTAIKAELESAQEKVAQLESKLIQAKATLEELKLKDTTSNSTESSAPAEETTPKPVDTSATIQTQEQVVADLEATLTVAKEELAKAQATVDSAKAIPEVQVDLANQEQVIAKIEQKLAEAKAKQEKVNERLAQLTKVNEKGELTADALAALGGKVKVDGQQVTVEFDDELTMEALKGRTVTVIIYTAIKDGVSLIEEHYTDGISNTATVQYNHNPNGNFTKKTNTVKVIPPRPTPPAPEPPAPVPPVPTPEPPVPTPPTPPVNQKILPKTGATITAVWEIVGLIVGLVSLVFYTAKKKKQDA
ncbi:isopeptide-forming domain-containing fimbrial protein, partial [Streptococcus caledonicus]